jgi:hypothetical protein
VHHVEHWIDGGDTAIGNLVLLCKPNHRDVHRGDWIIQIVDGTVLVTRPGWAEPDHPQPAHPEPGRAEPSHAEPGRAEWAWGSEPAERTGGGAPVDLDDGPGGERSGGLAEPVSAEPPAGWSSAGGLPASEAGGWPRGGRGSGAGERAWPWSGDPPPLTREAADRLNPWGDDQPPSATPTRRAETTTETTEAWPWGDGDDASPGP